MASRFSAAQLKAASSASKNLISSSGDDKKYATDDRFWKISRDPQTGAGRAIIRLLPSLNPDALPWVQVFDYFIKAPNGRWYVNNSRRTINQPDPMREYIHELWQSAGNNEVKKDELRKSYRERMQYVANILVVKDPDNPQYEGKVMLFKFGKKLMEKIIAKSQDELGDSCNPFDWMEGCDLKLRVRLVDKFPNYDSSDFGSPKPVGDDETIERIADAMYDLNEFVDPKNFKSYEELKKQVDENFRLIAQNGEAMEYESSARSTVPQGASPRSVSPLMKAAMDAQKAERDPWEEDNTPAVKEPPMTSRKPVIEDDSLEDVDSLLSSLDEITK